MRAQYMLVDRPRAFRLAPRIWFGCGASRRISECVRELGIDPGPVLLVMDTEGSRLDLARGIVDELRSTGFEIHQFSEIVGEPTAEVADQAVARARGLGPALVVGVGGGSVMDVAKLSAALVRNPGTVTEYTHFVGRRFAHRGVPMILAPTTAGTGSETSQAAVVTVEGRKAFAKEHPQLVAAAVILDPGLTYSLPPAATAQTGLDALSHCIEGILSTGATALTDLVCLQGIELIIRALPHAYANGRDADARARMLLGAHMGGLATNAGLVLGHSIAYTLANRLRLPHGLSCALALPYAMAYNQEAAVERLTLVARAAGGNPGSAVGHVQAVCRDVGIPESLRVLGLKRDNLRDLADECLSQYPRPNNPRPPDRDSLVSLYTAMWEGQPAESWRN